MYTNSIIPTEIAIETMSPNTPAWLMPLRNPDDALSQDKLEERFSYIRKKCASTLAVNLGKGILKSCEKIQLVKSEIIWSFNGKSFRFDYDYRCSRLEHKVILLCGTYNGKQVVILCYMDHGKPKYIVPDYVFGRFHCQPNKKGRAELYNLSYIAKNDIMAIGVSAELPDSSPIDIPFDVLSVLLQCSNGTPTNDQLEMIFGIKENTDDEEFT